MWRVDVYESPSGFWRFSVYRGDVCVYQSEGGWHGSWDTPALATANAQNELCRMTAVELSPPRVWGDATGRNTVPRWFSGPSQAEVDARGGA